MRMLGCSGQSKMDPELCQRPALTPWWRRGESEYSVVLKTRNLLIFRDAKNAETGKIAPNWNASGTRDFQFSCQFCEVFLERKKISKRRIVLNHQTRHADAGPFHLRMTRLLTQSGPSKTFGYPETRPSLPWEWGMKNRRT